MTDFDNMNRRDFLRGLTGGTLTVSGLIVEEITANAQGKKPAAGAQVAPKPAAPAGPAKAPVNCAVIGLGPQGREILTGLSKMGTEAPVLCICDTFDKPVHVKKSQAIAPKAQFNREYRAILDNKDIKAVFIATPSHKHKQVALDAIQAGKHVYLEMPFSQDLDEAKAIAQAGMAAKTMFQPGLQVRCSAQAEHVNHFMLSSALGKIIGGQAHWRKRSSWRQASGFPGREEELNWRLKRATSSGLLGEIGLHQIDTATWYLKALPVSVTGSSAIMEYSDGRDVPDTVQAIVEYPGDARFGYDATLCSSFDDTYELFFGTQATVMLRDQRGWMFKEAGAGQLGWEVFARKDAYQIGRPDKGSGLLVDSGIALVADATKQLALGKTDLTTDATKTSLFYSLTAFLDSVRAGKRVPVKEPSRENPRPPLTPTALDGYRANVVAIKANEAALTGSKIVFQKEWYDL